MGTGFHFKCPVCGQYMEAPAEMAGLTVLCSACGQRLSIPRSAKKARLAEAEVAKKSTIRIDLAAQGGLPPEPKPRRVVIKRAAGR
ncbi:MAG: hypothetical protein NTV49_14710 [Kiritimatiellaeota bacterium]|nr:hypothetical protein [Kiritimatiellota bacterium]